VLAVLAGTAIQAHAAPESSVVAARFDAEGYSQLLVPVRVENAEFWCSLDSGGSWVLSLDTAKALKAGLRPTGRGMSAGVGPAAEPDQRVYNTTVGLGHVVLRSVTIVLRPQSPAVPDMDCVMGLGLLADYVVQFDYLTPSVRIFDAGAYRPSRTATAVPMSIDRFQNPYLEATLALTPKDQVRANLMLDTGASFVSAALMQRFVADNGITTRLDRVIAEESQTPGVEVANARLSSLHVGPFQVTQPVITLLLTPSAGVIHDGMVGAGFLKRFTVTFDYAHRQVWFEPNGRSTGRQAFDASGLELRHLANGEYVVRSVASGSAGASAGVRPGDHLAQIDGTDASQLTLADLKTRLSRDGALCTLRLRRNGTTQTATLHLKERL